MDKECVVNINLDADELAELVVDKIRAHIAVDAEVLARAFHAYYEELAPKFDYKTREASAVPWSDVPENNKALMIAVAERLITDGIVIAKVAEE